MIKKTVVVGMVLVLASSLFYASYGIWTALMGDFFGGYTASALRSLLVLILLVPIAWYGKQIQSFNLMEHRKTLFWMIISSTLIRGPLYFAILDIGVAISLSVNYSLLVLGFIFFGWCLLGEKFTVAKGVSALVGILGLGFMFFPGLEGSLSLIGLLAASLSGFAAGATMVLAKKLPYNAAQSSIVVWSCSVLANIPLAFILREPFPSVGLHIEWLYLLFFAIASILATWLVLQGMKYVDAGTAGIIGLTEIVFGVLFGVMLFGEEITMYGYIGIALILLAAGFPYIYSKESS